MAQRGKSTVPTGTKSPSFGIPLEKEIIANKRNGMDAGMTSREFNTVERHSTSL